MDLSHEEKLIAMKGFQAGIEKDASLFRGTQLAIGKGLRALKSGFKAPKSNKALARSMNIGRTGTKSEKKLMALGGHIADNKPAYAAAAGGAGGAGLIAAFTD